MYQNGSNFPTGPRKVEIPSIFKPNFLSKLNRELQNTRAISSYLNNHGMNKLSSIAKFLGYGKRKKKKKTKLR
jgi:hypothetical protein